jgi:hypothetical protein
MVAIGWKSDVTENSVTIFLGEGEKAIGHYNIVAP